MIVIENLYEIFEKHPFISTDSRNIKPGCLFFALKGANFNGNHFALNALRDGAAYAIVDEPVHPHDERIILVDDVLKTLQELASFHRKRLGLPILAITGSNGKTTTKELVASVLSQKYNLEFTRGNLNNHIGVPLTLLTFTKQTEFGVVEMGANHSGEIDFLCRIANPNFGLVTNVGKAHLEGFGSFEGVIRTKTEMYRYIENVGGCIFLNGENEYLTKEAINNSNKVTYGTNESNWLRGEIIDSPPYLNLRAWFPKGVLYLNTRLIGSYNFENVLAAAAIGRYFGVDPLLIKKGIEEYVPSNNRSQFIKTSKNQVIMDAYNANPTSMKASIINFLTFDSPAKTAILGDMLELGEYSDSEHQAIVDLLSNETGIKVILVGEIFSKTSLPGHFNHFPTTAEAREYITEHSIDQNLILIKGSRGIGLEKILDVL